MDEATIERIRAAWRQVIGAPDAFLRRPGVIIVPVADRDGGRREVGVVRLAGATCVLAPADLAGRLDARAAARLADPGRARAVIGDDVEVIGPAVLAYADRSIAPRLDRLVDAARRIEPAEPGSAELARLAAACDPADVDESAFADWAEWIRLAYDEGVVAAGAGIEVWAGTLAHVGVLTRPDRRGRGLARAAAGSAVRAALAAGLVAQWRARATLTASRRVAAALGFVELGAQVLYRLPGRPPSRATRPR